MSLRPARGALLWRAGAPGDSIVSAFILRACDGLGGCTDSARAAAEPYSVVGPDVFVLHIGLACSALCSGDAPVEVAGCAIGGGGVTHNRVCLSWPQVAFGQSPAMLYGPSLVALLAEPPALAGGALCMLIALGWLLLHVDIAAAVCAARACSRSRSGGRAMAAQLAMAEADDVGSGAAPAKSPSPAMLRRRAAAAASVARRSLACTWAAAGCALLVCAVCVLAALPVGDKGGLLQGLVATALRPPGTAWAHPALSPLPAPVLRAVVERAERLRGGAPAPEPASEWLRLALVACLLASLAGRLLLPIAMVRRVGALLRASTDNVLPMGGIVMDDSLGTLRPRTAARLHKAATLVVSAAATAVKDAAWGYGVLAGSVSTLPALLQVLASPPLLYSSCLLPVLVARLVAGRLLPPESSAMPAAATPESAHYSALLLTQYLRRAVRADVLVLGTLADAPLVALLACALSALRASSPLAAVCFAAAGVHALGYVSLAAPWRWFELGAHAAAAASSRGGCCGGGAGRRPASGSGAPPADADVSQQQRQQQQQQQQQQQLVEPARAYLAQHSLLVRALTRLAPPSVEAALVEAYVAVNSDVLPLLAAAASVHGAASWGGVGGKRAQAAEAAVEEVGGISPLGAALATAAAKGGRGGKQPQRAPAPPAAGGQRATTSAGEPPGVEDLRSSSRPAPDEGSIGSGSSGGVGVGGIGSGGGSSGGGEKAALNFSRRSAAPTPGKVALDWSATPVDAAAAAPAVAAAAAAAAAAAPAARTRVDLVSTGGGAPPAIDRGAQAALDWQAPAPPAAGGQRATTSAGGPPGGEDLRSSSRPALDDGGGSSGGVGSGGGSSGGGEKAALNFSRRVAAPAPGKVALDWSATPVDAAAVAPAAAAAAALAAAAPAAVAPVAAATAARTRVDLAGTGGGAAPPAVDRAGGAKAALDWQR